MQIPLALAVDPRRDEGRQQGDNAADGKGQEDANAGRDSSDQLGRELRPCLAGGLRRQRLLRHGDRQHEEEEQQHQTGNGRDTRGRRQFGRDATAEHVPTMTGTSGLEAHCRTALRRRTACIRDVLPDRSNST